MMNKIKIKIEGEDKRRIEIITSKLFTGNGTISECYALASYLKAIADTAKEI